MSPRKRPHGTIRQSQMITTYGPGATVDLPRHAVIVGGLEHWTGMGDPIIEERLVAKLENLLQVRGLKLLAPPAQEDDPGAPVTGITAFLFPEWFIAQWNDRSRPWPARPLVHRTSLESERWLGPDRRRYAVVPVRFVQGCPNGHISDIQWHGFVHVKDRSCRRQLWIEERGTSGDLADVFIRCDCGESRSMLQATRPGPETLGFCNGLRPWLGRAARERCGGEEGPAQLNRLLTRSASDTYFPQVLRVISIPDRDLALRNGVASVWEDFLQYVDSPADLPRERRKAKVAAALGDCPDEQVMAEIARRRGTGTAPMKTIKQAEMETLMASDDEMGDDAPEGADFFARRFALGAPSKGPLAKLDRLVLLHRVREVMALTGFTRFEPAVPDIEGELSLGVRRADLAQDTTWLPAVEIRGEGLFLAFKPALIDAWLARPAVKKRGGQLLAGFQAWHDRHPGGDKDFPGLPYVLLHSLSHLLITALSLECGYSASSIRERIYAGSHGYGILLSTGTPDSEGTLGGLVALGRDLESHVRAALDLGRLCSNDPVCAQHRPDNLQEERFLHGAACHGCVLIAEPSCERRNDYLDRALVVPTVDEAGAAFFGEDD